MKFKAAFKRKAKREQHKREMPHAHWRHRDRSWEVVSTVLTDRWDNAVHPEDHDDFKTVHIGMSNGIPRHVPENSDEWEMFHTDEKHVPMIVDKPAYRQFETAFRNDIDFLNVDEIVDFLYDTFEAEYEFDDPMKDCSNCDGTGRVCGADDCPTYCSSGCGSSDEPLYVSDSACSCSGCNYSEHWETCDDCDGRGTVYRNGFTRTFPYTRDRILSEKPSRKERQILQFTLNRMANIAGEDTMPSFRKVLQLFSLYEHGDTETLIETAISYIEPSFDTVEEPKRGPDGDIVNDDAGNPVMVTKPDPDEIDRARQKFTSMLLDETDAAGNPNTASEQPA